MTSDVIQSVIDIKNRALYGAIVFALFLLSFGNPGRYATNMSQVPGAAGQQAVVKTKISIDDIHTKLELLE